MRRVDPDGLCFGILFLSGLFAAGYAFMVIAFGR